MKDIDLTFYRETLLDTGDILRSRYRIVRQLGHGGFSRTYLAEDTNRFDELCVLKEFAPQLKGTFATEKAQELFEREAGVLYRLQHPQIPQFRQLFRHKQANKDLLFLVQDYIDGENYHALLNQRLAEKHKFSEAEVKQLLIQVLPILEYIHSMGVIHRDISPDNLILRKSDKLPVLIDFGCIKEVELKTQQELETDDSASLSLTGTALGKAGYAPPEQVERGIVYAHSDLYALAMTAVVLLAGKEPLQLIDRHDHRWHWRSYVNINPKLEWILSTMLSPHPSNRFGSAAEVLRTLEDIAIITKFPASISDRQQAPIRSQSAKMINWGSKSLFFISFTAMLILGGYLCLKVMNLETSKPLTNNSITVDNQIQDRFSTGEKILIPKITTPAKEMGVAATGRSESQNAIDLFTTSLKTEPNDPETLIYLNNARIGQAKSYSIAVSIPIGSDTNAAQEILRGVAQAQNRINEAGGINHVPLKIQIINDDNDPEIAKQIAQSLGKDQTILGVVGHYASDVTLATASVYEANQLVTISPISTSVELSDRSPYIFRTVPSDYLAARGLADYMLGSLQQQKVAVFYNSESNYSKSLRSEFTAAVHLGGGEVVSSFDLADPNFDAGDTFAEAAAKGTQTIMLASSTSTLDKALQVVKVNRQRLNILGGDDVYTPKTLQIAGEDGKNMVIAIPWHIRANLNGEFSLVAQQLWGGEVSWRSAMAYDAAQALITAIASSPNPTRDTIQQQLSERNFTASGASNQVNFLPSGDRLGKIQLVQMQPANNKFGYQFLPIDN